MINIKNNHKIGDKSTKNILLSNHSNKCFHENEFNLPSNNKCYKLIRSNKSNDNKINICEDGKRYIFEMKNVENLNILKSINKEFINNSYIDVGVRCDLEKVCRYKSSDDIIDEEIKKLIPYISENCILLYNTESKVLECKEEFSIKDNYSYLCQRDTFLDTKSCSSDKKIRKTDNFCYNKEKINSNFSNDASKNLCNDMEMQLPILEALKSIDVGKTFSKEMDKPLWVNMHCQDNDILICKWNNDYVVDLNNYFSHNSIQKKNKDENCVYIDNKSKGLHFSNCSSLLGVFCQSYN
ncbi:C-type lectin-like domain and C-type lectin fold domain-containing protein [Strongyloides ratti]|uniref:C-type lectin-like domain and C-type lectin fold domain-containing protein n=1 Tax=Strongyloides ratti TaxID=34506 RepID=A0A090MSK5_STRRB|nr:C-type lectin-like domain and C-type lectin fold domain-containing protein [Strongyloides ratti]CEF61238.1 C-type lectin-like domain and C-type lectin fold domain-containing protein [Strongyloides ratti]